MFGRISGGFGVKTPPTLPKVGLYRSVLTTGSLIGTIPSIFYTNGKIQPQTEAAFKLGVAKNVLGNFDAGVLPLYDGETEKRSEVLFSDILRALSISDVTLGTQPKISLDDIKYPSRVPAPERGIRFYYEGKNLIASFDDMWYTNVMTEVQRAITDLTYTTKWKGVRMVGLATVEVSGKNDEIINFVRPTRYFRFGADGLAEANYKMNPFTKTEALQMAPYYLLLHKALKAFNPLFYKNLNSDMPDMDFYAYIWFLLNAFTGTSTSVNVPLMRTATDIAEKLYTYIGFGVTKSDAALFLEVETWQKYFVFCLLLGLALQRIQAYKMPVEIRRLRGGSLTVYGDWIKALEPYSESIFGSDTSVYFPIPSKYPRGLVIPCIVDDSDNAHPNFLQVGPHLNKDKFKTDHVEVRNGEWTTNAFEPTDITEKNILPYYVPDTRILTIEWRDRTEVDISFPLEDRVDDTRLTEQMRLDNHMITMLTDLPGAFVVGQEMEFDGMVRHPRNIPVWFNRLHEPRQILPQDTQTQVPKGVAAVPLTNNPTQNAAPSKVAEPGIVTDPNLNKPLPESTNNKELKPGENLKP